MIKLYACVAISVSALFIPANAAPGSATRYAMSEPATMFDLGMLRTEINMEEIRNRWSPIAGSIAPYTTGVVYDYDNDQIVISLIMDADVLDDAEAQCKSAINYVRSEAGIDQDGEPLNTVFPTSGFARNFAHVGFAKSSEPESFLENIDQRIYIRCGVPGFGASVKSKLRSSVFSVTIQ